MLDRRGGILARHRVPGSLEKLRPKVSYALQLFATNLDPRAIARARRGEYPANIASEVNASRLRRFFVRENGGTFRVNKDLRESLIMAQQDVTRDPPFTRMDLVFCRNLLIYLEPDLQRRIISVFHYSLKPGGILFLGTAETLCGLATLSPIDPKLRIYRRKGATAAAEAMGLSSFLRGGPSRVTPQPEESKASVSLQASADELLLRQFGPAAVLVNDRGDILYTNGPIGRYLEPTAGKANWNVLAMAREGLRYGLSGALHKALKPAGRSPPAARPSDRTEAPRRSTSRSIRPGARPASRHAAGRLPRSNPAPHRGARGREPGQRPACPYLELEREARRLHDELRGTREDMQATQEELRSANEELQSTNEELTTSKEEMQSMNEELQTVNAELQAKVDELSRREQRHAATCSTAPRSPPSSSTGPSVSAASPNAPLTCFASSRATSAGPSPT